VTYKPFGLKLSAGFAIAIYLTNLLMLNNGEMGLRCSEGAASSYVLAQTQDAARSAAEKYLNEGERLRAEDTAEALRAAIGKFEEALKLFRSLGDSKHEAETLDSIGLSYTNLNENQKALEYHNLALALKRKPGNAAGEAATLNHIANARMRLSEYEEAL